MKNASEWTDADSANFILEWVEEKYADALAESVKAGAEEAGRVTMEKFWDEKNPDDGIGFSQNPYRNDKERNLKRINSSSNNFIAFRKILDFVRNRICNLIEEL